MKALQTFSTKPSKLKLKRSLGAYYNKKKCAKSPREHFIDPQTQATFLEEATALNLWAT